MIDIKKALSQRCYIIFDSNEQLVKFVDTHNLSIYICICTNETGIRIIPNDPDGYLTGEFFDRVVFLTDEYEYPRYHHTELTITDDGE
jgi:hypothetical protein